MDSLCKSLLWNNLSHEARQGETDGRPEHNHFTTIQACWHAKTYLESFKVTAAKNT